MTMMFLIIPACIGSLIADYLRIKDAVARLLSAWVIGFVQMLAVGQLILVPFVKMQQSLTNASILFRIALQLLVAAALIHKLWMAGKETEQTREEKQSGQKKNLAAWLFCGIAFVMILMQAYIPARYEHSDDDDARFIAEEVSAVVHDSMYQDDPITADFMYWDVGEVKKDLTSPWAMYLSILCKMSGMAPAVLSHTYLPFFLILLCYGVYALIGNALLKGDWEKTGYFLILLSVLNLWGYTSTHTMPSMLLLRIWQGKAVCASFSLPLFFYLFWQIMKREHVGAWIIVIYVLSIGSCLLSGIGIVTAPVVVGIYGLTDFFFEKNWKRAIGIFGAVLPCLGYLIYYMML